VRIYCLLLAASLGACAAAPQKIVDRSDFLAEATRVYPNETSERVIDAAQAVIKQSDPNNVEFRNTLNGFTALRRYFIYAVLASAEGRERWEFTADKEGAGIKAGLTISEAGSAGRDAPPPPQVDPTPAVSAIKPMPLPKTGKSKSQT
jgi:hypothetical protein